MKISKHEKLFRKIVPDAVLIEDIYSDDNTRFIVVAADPFYTFTNNYTSYDIWCSKGFKSIKTYGHWKSTEEEVWKHAYQVLLDMIKEKLEK